MRFSSNAFSRETQEYLNRADLDPEKALILLWAETKTMTNKNDVAIQLLVATVLDLKMTIREMSHALGR